jgi:hypothetical protein
LDLAIHTILSCSTTPVRRLWQQNGTLPKLRFSIQVGQYY